MSEKETGRVLQREELFFPKAVYWKNSPRKGKQRQKKLETPPALKTEGGTLKKGGECGRVVRGSHERVPCARLNLGVGIGEH